MYHVKDDEGVVQNDKFVIMLIADMFLLEEWM